LEANGLSLFVLSANLMWEGAAPIEIETFAFCIENGNGNVDNHQPNPHCKTNLMLEGVVMSE